MLHVSKVRKETVGIYLENVFTLCMFKQTHAKDDTQNHLGLCDSRKTNSTSLQKNAFLFTSNKFSKRNNSNLNIS